MALVRLRNRIRAAAPLQNDELHNGVLEATEVDAFISRRWLITVRENDRFSIGPVLERWDRSPDLAAHGVRMTWIKPSFLWMMYRSGWATKPGQERVLAIAISRDGFEWALAHSWLSHYEPGTYASRAAWAEQQRGCPVRVQWDPEHSLRLSLLAHRTIQIGLSGEAARRFVSPMDPPAPRRHQLGPRGLVLPLLAVRPGLRRRLISTAPALSAD
jgi:hypothetical protein